MCIESIEIVNLLIVYVHFNIWKNWLLYDVYIGNSSYFFFFAVVCSCFSGNNRLIFVLLFLFFTLVCILTTSFDKFGLQCQKRLSQINIIVPIRLKFKPNAVFIKWGNWINFLFMWGQDIFNNWDFPSKISRHCHKRLVSKIVVWHEQREVFVKMSLRGNWIVQKILLEWFSSVFYRYPTVFSEFAFPQSLKPTWMFFYRY